MKSGRLAVGVRDAAREGSTTLIRQALQKLIAEVRRGVEDEKLKAPVCVAAAGMIGSPLGLLEVAYVSSPAGLAELAAGSRWIRFPDVTELPVLLVPGVRSGSSSGSAIDATDIDVMRGEETLCVGLVTAGLVIGPAVVLNLGSHWKAIELDQNGKITSSFTSLSGELIHALQVQTILSGSVSSEQPQQLAPEWIEAGMREQRRAGLSRALFCVRLLDLEHQGTGNDRLAFLIGAVLASDLDAMLAHGILKRNRSVALIGPTAIAGAWQRGLSAAWIEAAAIPPTKVEQAYLAGLHEILARALPRATQGITA